MGVFVHLHRRPRALPVAAVTLAALTWLAGCSQVRLPPQPVRAVKLVTVVGAGPLTASHDYAGEVKARVESRLGFRVAGKLTERLVDVGQQVRAGQPLARLDVRDYRIAVEAARSQATVARTQRDLADADFRRYYALYAKNFISGAELQRREASLTSAQATLEQAQAQLSTLQHQAGDTQLRAEAAGVITAVEAEVGQVLAAGTPVVRLARDGARDVVFAVPEDRVAAFARGLPMRVSGWQDGTELLGRVREVAASADPVTRTFTVKLTLPDTHTLPLGATVTVRSAEPRSAAAAVQKLPTTALWQQGRGTAVWVLEPASMTVRPQTVEVIGMDGNEALIGSGLQAGQQVVVAGVHVLSPGQKVTRWQSKDASAQPTTPPAAKR